MLKLLGCFLLSVSVWLSGKFMSKRIKRKMDMEDGLLSLIEYIKVMISSQGMALCEIYWSVKDPRLDVPDFYDNLRKNNCNALSDALTVICEHDCNANVCEDAKKFASAVGNCFCSEDAAALCDKYIELLKKDIGQVRGEDKKREELFSKLGFLCACAVFVLII